MSLVSYTSPTILLAAVSLLLFFSRLKIKGHIIELVKFFAPLSFGVYLIHTHPQVWNYIMNGAFTNIAHMNPILMIWAVLGSSILIFLICVFIDWIRLKLFNIFKIKDWCEKFTSLIIACVDRILCRIIKE